MNTGIDFFPNLVWSPTPIAPFSPSPRLPPLPFLSRTSLSPFSIPFSYSLILSSLILFRHPQIQLRGLEKRSKFSPAESGREPRPPTHLNAFQVKKSPLVVTTKTWLCHAPKMPKVAPFPYVKYSKLSHMT